MKIKSAYFDDEKELNKKNNGDEKKKYIYPKD